MSPKDIAAAAFAGLRKTPDGWRFTEQGLTALETKLDTAVAQGLFSECSFEMAALAGFLAQRGDAEPALVQLTDLGLKFETQLQAQKSKHEERQIKARERASARLGASAPRRARIHDAPQEGLSLAQIAPHALLLDPHALRRAKKHAG